MEWLSLEKDTKAFFQETDFADYRITAKESFSKNDAEKISSIAGVDRTSRYISVNADVKGTENMVGLTVTENPKVSGFVVTDGEPYDENSKDGIWLSDKYAESNNVHTGDEMTLTYDKLTIKGKVKGLIKSGEYMICVRDASQLMPDFRLYGYAYITPKALRHSIDNMKYDTVHFLNEYNDRIALPEDGALVCMHLKDEYNLNIGDEIELSPYGTSEKYIVKIKGFNRSLSKSISISEEYAYTLRSTLKTLTYTSVYKINTIFTKTEKSKINDSLISSVQSKEDIMKSMDSFMEIMNLFVVILIISAVILGIIVLYNLGIMSFTERYREMATLKVIGFNDRKIGSLLISQNIWLSVLGIFIGIPTAYGTLALLIKMLAGEYEMSCYISLPSLLISTVLTLSVSFVVGLIIARKSRKIDMVSALKIPE